MKRAQVNSAGKQDQRCSFVSDVAVGLKSPVEHNKPIQTAEPMAWHLFQSGIPKSAISQETSFYLDVKQCLTSKSCHEYVHKHLVSEGFTYLYFNSSH